MKKTCSSLLIFLVSFVFLSGTVKSLALTLDMIGSMSTQGNSYSEWWYTGNNPTFAGTADANSTVSVVSDGDSQSVTADGSGNWSFNGGFAGGDHTLSFSQGGETISFTIRLGQGVPTDLAPQSTPGAVPDTGSHQLVAVISSISLIGAGVYFYSLKRSNKKFEEVVIKDL